MKKIAILFFSLLLFMPTTLAACGGIGSTVVYVNGIFTTLAKAKEDLAKLRAEFKNRTEDYTVDFINGYNPSHLEGVGDLAQVTAQMMGRSMSDYDLNTILLQIHPQVTTRRLLLVGHSQGSFYANEMHGYLMAHGGARDAVGVYNVGSPAASTAGRGAYLNSSGDTMLAWLRGLGFSFLPNNIDLVPSAGDAQSKYPGHSFSGAYLAEAPERVVGDIKSAIDKLKPVRATDAGECFTAPSAGVGYQATKAGFAVADTAATAIKVTYSVAQSATVFASNILGAAVAGAVDVGQKVASDVGITLSGLSEFSQAADGEHSPTNFDIVSRLYGSSLGREDIEDLLGDQGSAVASAPLFEPPVLEPPVPSMAEGEPAEETEAISTHKTIYLGGSGGSDEPEVVIDADAPATASSTTSNEPVASTSEPVATTTEPALSPTPSGLFGGVVINEVAWGGTSLQAHQWIELYNTSSDDIDLATTSLVIDDGEPIALSGIVEEGKYIVLQRVSNSITNTSQSNFVTVDFDELSSEPVQVSLIDSEGKLIDATPEPDACGSDWCGGFITPDVGYADYLGDKIAVSMERIDVEDDGTDPDNWASNDGYTRTGRDSQNMLIIGTPMRTNSEHWPMAGFFCGDGDILEPGDDTEPYVSESDCAAFFGDAQVTQSVGGAIFMGTVGSSTMKNSFSFGINQYGGMHKAGQASFSPRDAGEYFVALWHYNSGVGSPSTQLVGHLQTYLMTGVQQDGTAGPPGLHWAVIPFIIE